MIIVDANILIYAYNSSMPQHAAARAWLENAFAGEEAIRFPWTVILAFLRLTTSGRVMPHPVSISRVAEIVDEWLSLPHVDILEAGSDHWKTLLTVVRESQSNGDIIMDAHLAALAIAHEATICTADRDFERFEGVKLLNPLTP